MLCGLTATGKVWPCSQLAGDRSFELTAAPIRTNFSCVVACDIVNVPSYTHVDTMPSTPSSAPSKYYIVPEARHVRIRRLFVYRTNPTDTELKSASGQVAKGDDLSDVLTKFARIFVGVVLIFAILAYARGAMKPSRPQWSF